MDHSTVWVGNLCNLITEEILYELFLQVAPLQSVRIPKDPKGKNLSFGFVTFIHEESVQYAVKMLQGIRLFGRNINVKLRNSDKPNAQVIPKIPDHRKQQGSSEIFRQNMNPSTSNRHGNNSHNAHNHPNDRRFEHNDRRFEQNDRGGPYNRHNNQPESNFRRNESNIKNRLGGFVQPGRDNAGRDNAFHNPQDRFNPNHQYKSRFIESTHFPNQQNFFDKNPFDWKTNEGSFEYNKQKHERNNYRDTFKNKSRR